MSDSQASKILKLIKKKNRWGTPNWELSRISLKYSSRISELRKDGYNIQAVRVNDHGRWLNTWKYYLNKE